MNWLKCRLNYKLKEVDWKNMKFLKENKIQQSMSNGVKIWWDLKFFYGEFTFLLISIFFISLSSFSCIEIKLLNWVEK